MQKVAAVIAAVPGPPFLCGPLPAGNKIKKPSWKPKTVAVNILCVKHETAYLNISFLLFFKATIHCSLKQYCVTLFFSAL